MASENNEYRLRQQKRAEARRKRELARRKMWMRLALVGVVMAACCVLMWLVRTDGPVSTETGTVMSDPVKTAPEQSTEMTRPQEPRTVIHIAAAGDLNINDATVSAGSTPGGYDFRSVFLDAVPALSAADLTVMNLEGNLVGAPYGTDTSSAPPEMMEALADAGVDLIQMANSYSIQNGLLGLSQTLDGIRAAGMEPVGAYASKEEFRKTGGFTLCNVSGIKVAFVAFTKGMDNLGLPSGSEDCVNVLYEDYATTYQKINREKITAVLRNVAQAQPDYTIALLHWGSEYNDEISSTQESIRDLMFANGVDAILGTHPHLVQEVEFNRENGTFVAYSLGDFFGEGQRSGSNYSVVLDLEITRDNATGETKLTNYTYTPLYTVTQEEDEGHRSRIERIRPALEEYEADYFERIPEDLYHSMQDSLDSIEYRITRTRESDD